VLCGAGLFQAATAKAEFLAVPNFSFENPVRDGGSVSLGGTTDSNNAIVGWDISGDTFSQGGVFASTSAQFASLPDGNQFAYLASSFVGFTGNLSLTTSTNTLPAIVAGNAYTLTVAVGRRLDNTFPAGSATIAILANGNVVKSTTVNADAIAMGTFTDVIASLSAAETLALGGQQLGIKITQTNTTPDSGGHAQRNEAAFDNVRLFSDGAVPEPASIGVLALGAGALLTKRRRRIG
jgi:hypothetical protein